MLSKFALAEAETAETAAATAVGGAADGTSGLTGSNVPMKSILFSDIKGCGGVGPAKNPTLVFETLQFDRKIKNNDSLGPHA